MCCALACGSRLLTVHTESVTQVLYSGLREPVTGSAYRERDASAVLWPAAAGYWQSRLLAVHTESVTHVLCTGLQEQGTGSAYRERDPSAVLWPGGAGYWQCIEREQALCSGLREQVTGSAYRESVTQALCTGLQEQVTGSAYRERDASAVLWPAGAGYWQCIQRAWCKCCALACGSRLLAVHTESVTQVLCSGLREQVAGSAYRESVTQALCTGLREQVTGSAYRESMTQALFTEVMLAYSLPRVTQRVLEPVTGHGQERHIPHRNGLLVGKTGDILMEIIVAYGQLKHCSTGVTSTPIYAPAAAVDLRAVNATMGRFPGKLNESPFWVTSKTSQLEAVYPHSTPQNNKYVPFNGDSPNPAATPDIGNRICNPAASTQHLCTQRC
ncbi:hypothetical protein NDU88_007450 [Pleurodeles waltl]|uniref:Uncharacterized protein n=1 Tax=Pleurodeles waltl TaxID=8319 RepID=A0AAV7SSY2_PLEWA|nr:hypothetical protein NDU88_007450 [Pleurodeles waltl]